MKAKGIPAISIEEPRSVWIIDFESQPLCESCMRHCAVDVSTDVLLQTLIWKHLECIDRELPMEDRFCLFVVELDGGSDHRTGFWDTVS